MAGRPAVPIVDRIDWPGGVAGVVSGRQVDPLERGTTYGTANLALHVGDDAARVALHRIELGGALARPGEPTPTIVTLRANHGHAVRVIDASTVEDGPECYDALVTDRTDIALLAMAADCVPVALADPTVGVIAVAHAGWRGTASGVLAAAVGAMVEWGASPARIRMHLGPAACGRCYEVGDEVVEVLRASVVGQRDNTWCRTGTRGATIVDLRAVLSAQAHSLGLPPALITVTDRCTIEDPDLYSHRRDGRTAPTGRHGLLLRRSAA